MALNRLFSSSQYCYCDKNPAFAEKRV